MQQQLTTQEIERVLGMYIGQRGFLHNCEQDQWLVEINAESIARWKADDSESALNVFLKPLDQVSDDDAFEVAIMTGWKLQGDNTREMVIWGGREYIKQIIANDRLTGRYETIQSVYALLALRGYAAPLWVDIDHWANGKTAIELCIGLMEVLVGEYTGEELVAVNIKDLPGSPNNISEMPVSYNELNKQS